MDLLNDWNFILQGVPISYVLDLDCRRRAEAKKAGRKLVHLQLHFSDAATIICT